MKESLIDRMTKLMESMTSDERNRLCLGLQMLNSIAKAGKDFTRQARQTVKLPLKRAMDRNRREKEERPLKLTHYDSTEPIHPPQVLCDVCAGTERVCYVCGKPAFMTPGGPVCSEGHGGVDMECPVCGPGRIDP